MGAWIFMFDLDPHILWSGALTPQIFFLMVRVIYTRSHQYHL